MNHGIDVIVIGPGSVATAIWEKAEQMDFSPYQKTEYGSALEKYRQDMIKNGRKGYSPEHLGKIVLKALTTRRPPVRYGYAAVPHPLSNWILPQLLPKRLVDGLIANNLGLKCKPR